jgi:hypothetical protein
MIDPLTRLTAIEEIRQLTATPFGIAVRDFNRPRSTA